MSQTNAAQLNALWQRYQTHQDSEARDKIITHYLYLVKYAVGRMLVHLPSQLGIAGLVPDDYGSMFHVVDGCFRRYRPAEEPVATLVG